MKEETTDKVGSVGKEVVKRLSNESLAIIVIGIVAVTAMFVIGNSANELVAAMGGGLVGYLSRSL